MPGGVLGIYSFSFFVPDGLFSSLFFRSGVGLAGCPALGSSLLPISLRSFLLGGGGSGGGVSLEEVPAAGRAKPVPGAPLAGTAWDAAGSRRSKSRR